jgi:hypothetical protein
MSYKSTQRESRVSAKGNRCDVQSREIETVFMNPSFIEKRDLLPGGYATNCLFFFNSERFSCLQMSRASTRGEGILKVTPKVFLLFLFSLKRFRAYSHTPYFSLEH